MLPAGQKRRSALSRLGLSASPLWLLDEPALGLDTASIEGFGGLPATHRAGGGIVVADTLAALMFFMVTASLFPLAIGPAPGIVWCVRWWQRCGHWTGCSGRT